MKSSVVNIESVRNSSFGTGFVIDSDERGVYILTCGHVVDDVVTPVVENVLAKVITKGEFVDMAVLYVSKLHLSPLPLQIDACDSLDVDVIGFSSFNQSLTQKKHIKAMLYQEAIELHSKEDDLFYTVRKIKADDGFNFDRGNSGSPVICKSSGKVIAMVSNKEGSSIGYAIDIANLKTIWEKMPTHLLKESPTNIEQIEKKQKEPNPTPPQKPSSPKKSSLSKYLLLLIATVAIFSATYLFLKKSQDEHKNDTYIKDMITEKDQLAKEKAEAEAEAQHLRDMERQRREAEATKIKDEKERIAQEKQGREEEQQRIKEEAKVRFDNAVNLQREGFQALIDERYMEAKDIFQEVDRGYKNFDIANDVRRVLNSYVGKMKNKKTKIKALKKIIKIAQNSSKHINSKLLQTLIEKVEKMEKKVLPAIGTILRDRNLTIKRPIRNLIKKEYHHQ